MSFQILNNLDLNGLKITNVGTPIDVNDVVTKGYITDLINGLDPKESVVAVSGQNVTSLSGAPSSFDFSFGSPGDGDRVLLKNQTDKLENGIYIVNNAGAWTRSADAIPGDTLTLGAYVTVEAGMGAPQQYVVVNWFDDVENRGPYHWQVYAPQPAIMGGNGTETVEGNFLNSYSRSINVKTDGALNPGEFVAKKINLLITGDGETSEFQFAPSSSYPYPFGINEDAIIGIRDVETGAIVYPSVSIKVLAEDEDATVTVSFGVAPALGKQYKVNIIN